LLNSVVTGNEPSSEEEVVMPVRTTAVTGALLAGMLVIVLAWAPTASAKSPDAGPGAPAVSAREVFAAIAGSATGSDRKFDPTPVFSEQTAWYSLACVWSVCDTLFSPAALQDFSVHGYASMLAFDVWHPQVRAAISIYGPTIDALADQAMSSWPLLSIETVTSSVEWRGYSIGLYTVGQ
jgi:hypothetical protein